MARLSVMAGGFDVSRAAGGIEDRRRAREFVTGFAAAWTRPLAPGDGCGEDALRAAEDRLGCSWPGRGLDDVGLVLDGGQILIQDLPEHTASGQDMFSELS